MELFQAICFLNVPLPFYWTTQTNKQKHINVSLSNNTVKQVIPDSNNWRQVEDSYKEDSILGFLKEKNEFELIQWNQQKYLHTSPQINKK